MPTMSVADFVGTNNQPAQPTMRSEDEARSILNQMQQSSETPLSDSDRQGMMNDLMNGASVNMPGLVTGNTQPHKLQQMSTDEFLGTAPAQNKAPDASESFLDAVKGTRENSLNSLKRVYNGISNYFSEDKGTVPGRQMTPEEFDIYKKLGYTSTAKSALAGVTADSVSDVMPQWNPMSSTPSAVTLKKAADDVRANPDLYKDKPGIMDYLAGKVDSGSLRDFLSRLDNPNKLILEGSLPSNFIQSVANGKDQERYRYDQVQSILNAKKILANPDQYGKDQVAAAQNTMSDFQQKTEGTQKTTLDHLKDMKEQIVKHPAEAAAGLVNSLVQDPELLAIPGSSAARGSSLATKIGTGALEGAALNSVISAAQQSKDISGRVDEHELGSAAIVGLGLGGTMGALARGEKAYQTNLNEAKLNGTYEQILKDRAAHDAVIEDAVKGNTKVPTEVRDRINASLGIKSKADQEAFLKQRQADVKDAFKSDSEYADYLNYLAEEKQTRHELYMKDLEDARNRRAAEGSKAAEVDQAYAAKQADIRSRRQAEFEAATAARDEALRAKDHEAALAENDRIDSLRADAEHERLADVYGQNHPVVRNALLAAERSDRAQIIPKWQRGNVDPELLQKLGMRAGLITAGSAAGAYLYPENKKAGALMGAAAGLLLPAGGEGVRFRRGQSGAIGGLGARTADFGRLKDADTMLKAGKSPEDVYDSTGWYQGVDGKWKFEIPDQGASVNYTELAKGQRTGGTTAGKVINHDKLFEAYPQLKDVKIQFQDMPSWRKAVADPVNGKIFLNRKAVFDKTGPDSLQGVILHELQHNIQAKENFARGGGADFVKSLPQYSTEVDRLKKIGNLEDSAIPEQAAFNVYSRLSGETEARNVQGRMKGSTKRPFETEDVPAKDQVVQFRNQLASSEELPQNNKLPNEQELVEKAKSGNQVAFTKLYNHFAPQLKRFATSYVRDAGPKLGVDAGELAHIALAKGLMHLDQFSGDSSLSTWLHSIVKNEGLQLIRSGQSRIDTTSMFVHKPGQGPGSLGEGHILDEGNSSGMRAGVEERMADHESPESIEAARETEQMLNHAMRKLPENGRQAVKMFLLDGMSQEEIAQKLGIPQQTVSTLVFRGKKMLQDTLEKELGTARGTGKYPGRKAQTGSIDPELMKKLAIAGVGAGIGAWMNKKHPIWGAILGAGIGFVLRNGKDAFADIDKAVMPMSTRIKNKSEAIHFRLKEYYRVRNTATHDLIGAGDPFLQALHTLPKSAQALLERSILTGDRSVTDRLIAAIGNPQLKGGWEVMRTVLDGLGDNLLNMKMIKEKNPDYFPRIVKDKEGLFNALGKDTSEPLKAALEEANRDAVKKSGNPLTEVEQSDFINKYLAKNYKGGMSQRPGYSFARRFEEIPENLQPFYANLAESYHSYVRAAVKNIELAKFFGKDLVNKEQGGIVFPDLDKSIGEYVNDAIKAGKMNSADVKEVSDQIRAMFGNFEKGGNKTLQAGKNVTMAGYLGNPLSAVAQITTPVVTTYLQGMRPTLEAAVRKITGKQLVTSKDFGLADHMSEEFVGTSRSAKFLRGALKWGTFKYSDLFDKDIKLNAAVIKARQLAKSEKGLKELESKYKEGFGERFPALVKELKANTLGDNTKALAYGELSRSDPIDPVEFSQFYADNPNGRNLLALKSYMLKQIDLMRRDGYNEIKKGNRAKGIKNLALIGLVLGLNGMATQDVQNFLLGRPIKHHPSDLFTNMLKTFGWSEYASRQAFGETKPTRKNPTGKSKAKGKLFQTVGEAIAPPIPYEAMDDLWNRDPHAVSMIPIFGRFLAEYYKNRDKTSAQRKKEAQEL